MNGLKLAARDRLYMIPFLLLVVVLVLVVDAASADEPPTQPPLLTFLGETEGVVVTMVYDSETPEITLMVYSRFTDTVDAQITAVGVTDADGNELSTDFVGSSDKSLARGQVTQMVVDLDPDKMPGPGTYTIQFALSAPGSTQPVQETKVILIIEAPPKEDQATIEILNEELVAKFNRTDLTATLGLHLEVSQTTASNVKVILKEVHPGEKVVLLDFFDAWTQPELPVAATPHSVTLVVHPRQLSAAGWYTATVLVTADNAAPVEAPVKLMAREAKLEILDEDLVFESTRSRDDPLLVDFCLKVTGANAEGVQVSLKTVKVGEKEVAVATDFKEDWYIQKGQQELGQPEALEMDQTWTFVQPLVPRELPGPGVYKITVVVEAENASAKAEKDLTLILPTPTLVANPSKLELRRCWPDWTHWDGLRWRWFMGFLGCGSMQEGFTLRTVGEDDVVADARLASTLPRNTAGRPLSDQVQFVDTEGISLPDITVRHEPPQEIRVSLHLPGPGAGAYSGAIYVESPDLASPHTVDVTVKVRHLILLPILIIAAGVGATTWISHRRDPKRDRHALRERMFRLRGKLDEQEDFPEALRDKVQKALIDAAQKIRERRWEEAGTKLDEADRVLQAYKTARNLLNGLETKISSADPGRVVLDRALAELKLGKTAAATELATRAQKLFSEGVVLLKEIGELAKDIEDHTEGPPPCAEVKVKLKRQRKDIEEHIRTKEFSYDLVKQRIRDLGDRFYDHDALCWAKAMASRGGRLQARWDPGVLEQSGPYRGDITSLEDLIFAMAEGSPLSNGSIEGLRNWAASGTDLPPVEEARALVREGSLPEVEFEVRQIAPDERDLNVGVPVTLKVMKRIGQIRPREAIPEGDREAYSIQWPQFRDSEATYQSGGSGTEAVIVFKKPGSHKVVPEVTVEEKDDRGQTTGTRRGQVRGKTVTIPETEIVCTTPEEWRLAEGDVCFEVLPFAGQDTTRRKYSYAWTFTDGKSVNTAEPWSQHPFGGEGEYAIQVTVRDAHKVVIGWDVLESLTIHPSAKAQEEREKGLFRRQQWWVSGFSVVIACLGGAIATKAFDATFGSLLEYLVAFLWGAGVKATAESVTLGPLANRIAQLWGGASQGK